MKLYIFACFLMAWSFSAFAKPKVDLTRLNYEKPLNLDVLRTEEVPLTLDNQNEIRECEEAYRRLHYCTRDEKTATTSCDRDQPTQIGKIVFKKKSPFKVKADFGKDASFSYKIVQPKKKASKGKSPITCTVHGEFEDAFYSLNKGRKFEFPLSDLTPAATTSYVDLTGGNYSNRVINGKNFYSYDEEVSLNVYDYGFGSFNFICSRHVEDSPNPPVLSSDANELFKVISGQEAPVYQRVPKEVCSRIFSRAKEMDEESLHDAKSKNIVVDELPEELVKTLELPKVMGRGARQKAAVIQLGALVHKDVPHSSGKSCIEGSTSFVNYSAIMYGQSGLKLNEKKYPEDLDFEREIIISTKYYTTDAADYFTSKKLKPGLANMDEEAFRQKCGDFYIAGIQYGIGTDLDWKLYGKTNTDEEVKQLKKDLKSISEKIVSAGGSKELEIKDPVDMKIVTTTISSLEIDKPELFKLLSSKNTTTTTLGVGVALSSADPVKQFADYQTRKDPRQRVVIGVYLAPYDDLRKDYNEQKAAKEKEEARKKYRFDLQEKIRQKRGLAPNERNRDIPANKDIIPPGKSSDKENSPAKSVD